MLACHFIDPDLGIEKRDSKIKLVLGIQQNVQEYQKGIAFKCSVDLHFYALIIEFFRSA